MLAALVEATQGRCASAERWADAAASGSVEGVLPDGSPLESWIALLEAVLCRRGVARMRADAEHACTWLSPESPFLGVALTMNAISRLLDGDIPTADQILVDAVETSLRKRTLPTAAMALGERAALAIELRDWRAADRFVAEALSIIDGAHAEGYVHVAIVYAVAARTASHRGDILSAKQHTVSASRLRPLCTTALPYTAQFLLELASAYLELADPAGSRVVLRQIRDILEIRPDLGLVSKRADELQQMLDTIRGATFGASSLTPAELRLLPLLATHLSYADIGERLFISRNTVKSEAGSLLRKLGVSARGDAVTKARSIGLLDG